jgi:hypothetical protein
MKKQKKYVHLLVDQVELWSEEKKRVKNKKNREKKKMKINLKWFPNHDLHLTAVIVIPITIVLFLKACSN